MSSALLEVDDLTLEIAASSGAPAASVIDGVSLQVEQGTAVGLVGESGSGKSLTLRAIAGLLPRGVRTVRGTVRVDGVERPIDSRRSGVQSVGIIFQDPLSGLNPVMAIADQIAEAPRYVLGRSRKQAHRRVRELLDLVGVPENRAGSYPHELSGGMRQRVMIAIALSGEPTTLLCDEPTTALDVTIEAQILELLADLQHREGLAIIYVTHDLAVMSELCDEVAVMYAGRIVETGPTREVLDAPGHPYTLALLRSAVDIDTPLKRVHAIPGRLPEPGRRPAGCSFHPRCEFAREICKAAVPPLETTSAGRSNACIRRDEIVLDLTPGVHDV